MRHLFSILAQTYRVIALDLPGHGFTQLGARHRSGLETMAEDIASLAEVQSWRPKTIVGHSAGAAIALALAQRMESKPKAVVGINAALQEFEGMAGLLFPAMAKLLASMPFTATLFSGAAGRQDRVEALIESTGSRLDLEGIELYRRLVGDNAHVSGTLKMMAQWDLKSLTNNLPSIRVKSLFVVGTNDNTVPPSVSIQAAKQMQSAKVTELAGFGHLLHEECPADVAEIIRAVVDEN